MAEARNVVVAQSGGPSPAINNSLRGIVEACRGMPEHFGTVYGGLHGIEGVLREELLDLSTQDHEEIRLLRVTPAAGAIGTCRYKMREQQQQDLERLLQVFEAQGVGCFFYIGGNDSMETAHRISCAAAQRGPDLVVIGVPKTIDNDIGDAGFELIDHTPGYGSVARYWSHMVQNANQENAGSRPSDPVLVLQAMGRKTGFVPAAARLADPHRSMPLLILLGESGIGLLELADRVNDMLRQRGRAIVVLSEGLDVGELGERKDAFGHTMFSSGRTSVEQVVVNYLNEVGLAARGAARGNIPGTDQRCSIIHASTVDLEEAYRLGQKAVCMAAAQGGSGHMATVLREEGPIYAVRYDKVPLHKVASSERSFPAGWIDPSGCDLTDDFLRYARPLIGEDWPSVPLVGGLQRFARLEPLFAEKRLDAYVPQGLRG